MRNPIEFAFWSEQKFHLRSGIRPNLEPQSVSKSPKAESCFLTLSFVVDLFLWLQRFGIALGHLLYSFLSKLCLKCYFWIERSFKSSNGNPLQVLCRLQLYCLSQLSIQGSKWTHTFIGRNMALSTPYVSTEV